MIQIKRIYEPAEPDDGFRVLVDRLWPRGVSKEQAALDLWAKDIAPSTELRKWFGHQPDRMTEFVARYQDELTHNPVMKQFASTITAHPTTTFLYGTRDPKLNNAIVLRDYLNQ